MKRTKLTSLITLALTLVFALAVFAGCALKPKEEAAINMADLAVGGTLLLKVNPEIAISYDENGNVTAISARNNDAKAIIEAYDFSGKDTKTVVSELVTKIGEAGYFVEEVDGERRTITIEIESGSVLPNDVFLDDVIANVKDAVNSHNWTAPTEIYSEGVRYDDDIYDIDDTPKATVEPKAAEEPKAVEEPKVSEPVNSSPERVSSCTNPYCDDYYCDDIICDDGPRTCTNPYCDDNDCDDLYCDEGPRTCTNPYCNDNDCDDLYCDEGPNDRDDDKDVRTCTNPYCYDDDCDDVICDEDDRYDD